MTTSVLLLHLYTETPVHAGGSESVGAVDLPIQREVTTDLPQIWSQTLKGALKQRVRDQNPFLARDLLGSEPGDASTKPGRIDILDAMLVAFPVATLHSTFAWVTSPLLLDRLRRRHAALGHTDALPAIPVVPDTDALVHPDHADATAAAFGPYALTQRGRHIASAWATHLADTMLPTDTALQPFRDRLTRDLAVVADPVLRDIATECVELQARVQLHRDPDRRKTVQKGPFYTEYLPADALLSAMAVGPTADLRTLADAVRGVFWLGGHESVGKGLLWCRPVLTGQDPA